jgi:RNA polymerase sigma-70 factor, ECF subfamily
MPLRSRQTEDTSPGSFAKVISLPVPRSEAGLVNALHQHQPGAMAALVDRHGEYLLKVAARILGPELDAEPVVTEAIRRGLESLHLLREPGALRTFLTSLVVSVAMDRLRARRWRGRLSRVFSLLWNRPDQDKPLPEWSETLLATYRVLDSMADRERAVFVLRFMQGMELSELSCVFGQSLRTIRSRLAQAEKSFLRQGARQAILHPWISPKSQFVFP